MNILIIIQNKIKYIYANFLKILVILIVVFILGVVFTPLDRYLLIRDVTATVTAKETKRYGDSDTYLIFTKNETFKNEDDIAFLKWNSSDIYGNIEIGKTYKFKVTQLRFAFFSMYRNIISYEEVVSP
jgi:hypothetical protein